MSKANVARVSAVSSGGETAISDPETTTSKETVEPLAAPADNGTGDKSLEVTPPEPQTRKKSSRLSKSGSAKVPAEVEEEALIKATSGRSVGQPKLVGFEDEKVPAAVQDANLKGTILDYFATNSTPVRKSATNTVTHGAGKPLRRPKLIYENTYQLDPNFPFSSTRVEPYIRMVLEEMFCNFTYTSEGSSKKAVQIAEKIRRHVLSLHFSRQDRQVQIVTPREPTRDVCVCTNTWGCPYPVQQWTNGGPPRQSSMPPPGRNSMPQPQSRQNSMPQPRQNSMPPPGPRQNSVPPPGPGQNPIPPPRPPQPQPPQYGACGPWGCPMRNRPQEAGHQTGTGAYRQSMSPPPQQPTNGNPYFCSNMGCCRTQAPTASNGNGITSMTWDQLRSLDLSNCTITITCGTGGKAKKFSQKDTGVNPEPEISSMYGPMDVEDLKSEPVASDEADEKLNNKFGEDKFPKNVKRRPGSLQEEPRVYSLTPEEEEAKEEPQSGAESKAASESSSQKSTSSKSSGGSGENSPSGSELSSSTEASGQQDGTSENPSDSLFDEGDKKTSDAKDRRSKRNPTDGVATEAESETLGDQMLGSSSIDKPPMQAFSPDGTETQPINIGSESTLENKVGEKADSDANSNVSVQAKGKRPSSRSSVDKQSEQSSRSMPVNELINEVIAGLQAKKIPLIWVYGYTQASLSETKARCLRQIADALEFAIVNMDLFYDKCSEINENSAGSTPEEAQLAAHAHQLFSKAGVYKNLDTFDICALYKTAIVLKQIQAPRGSGPKGFILDEFPVNSLEGSQAESELPSSPVGIYFLNSKCSESPDCETEVEPPMKDLRGATYNERAVNKAADDFGFKTVKVLNAEELDASQIGDIIELVEKHIKGQGLELHEAVEVEEEVPAPASKEPTTPRASQDPKSKKKRKKSKK